MSIARRGRCVRVPVGGGTRIVTYFSMATTENRNGYQKRSDSDW